MKNLSNNLVFAFEVVLKIARADVHFIGNINGRGLLFTLFIKQLQAGMENAIPGFH
jgi:hypothetical protein